MADTQKQPRGPATRGDVEMKPSAAPECIGTPATTPTVCLSPAVGVEPQFDPTVTTVAMGAAVAATTAARAQKGEEDAASKKPIFDQAKSLLLDSKINILLAAVPVAFLTEPGAINFIACFLALMPLATMLGDLTEDIAKRTNDTTAALINVTFGNFTELVVAVVAMRQAQIDLVKYSLVGSVLSNGLLVLGSTIAAGGRRLKIVAFNADAALIYGGAINLSCFAFILTSALDMAEPSSDAASDRSRATLNLSRWCSVFLIVVYTAYIYMTQHSHKHLFEQSAPTAEDVAERKADAEAKAVVKAAAKATKVDAKRGQEEVRAAASSADDDKNKPDGVDAADNNTDASDDDDDDDDDDDETPQYSWAFALIATALVTVAVSAISDLLVASVTPAAIAMNMSRAFIGIILIPIAGNVTEHGSALIVAMRGRIDLGVGIALGSAVQIAMFAFPFTVLAGVFMGVPLDLSLPPFLLAALVMTAILIYMITSSGKSTWLGGAMLICAYLVLAIALWNSHDPRIMVRITAANATTTTTTQPPVRYPVY